MEVLRIRNVHQGIPEMLDRIQRIGIERKSRYGDVIKFPEPCTIVYEDPRERVIFWPERDANPFFLLLESVWMLCGRRDVKFVSQFVKRMSSFSDDGKKYHAAYGFRWRKHFKQDQLPRIIESLRNNNDCRRQYLGIWDPKADLGRIGLDLPCLAGDTIIWSPEGDMSIKWLAEQFKDEKIKKWPIYTVDTTNWTLKLTWATRFWCSGKKSIIKITFDDGSSIKLTKNHRLYKRNYRLLKNGISHHIDLTTEIQAGELLIGDRILATHRWLTPKGHELIKYRLGENTNFHNARKVHREYWKLVNGEIPDGYVVHHEDEVEINNKIKNLMCITAGEHNRIHRLGDKNPMRNMTPEQHRKRALKQGASLSANWDLFTPEQRRERTKHSTANLPKSGNRKDNHRIVSIEECGEELVYDFYVPDTNTALIGTGVVAHNCNVGASFQINDFGQLDMVVHNRSNDGICGAMNANSVHFSILQEYIAVGIGIPVGRYWQVSSNLHIYKKDLEKFQGLAVHARDPFRAVSRDPYERREVIITPVVDCDLKVWEEDLHMWMRNPKKIGLRSQFFLRVATPMFMAHKAYKKGDIEQALEIIDTQMPEKSDWKRASQEWLERRASAKRKETGN